MLIDPLPLGLPLISQYFKYDRLDPLFLLLYHPPLCGYLTLLHHCSIFKAMLRFLIKSGARINQGFGSGSVLDPYSIGPLDPDPGEQK
jgi:hypothetical protein